MDRLKVNRIAAGVFFFIAIFLFLILWIVGFSWFIKAPLLLLIIFAGITAFADPKKVNQFLEKQKIQANNQQQKAKTKLQQLASNDDANDHDMEKEYNNFEDDDFLKNAKVEWQGNKEIEFLYSTRNSSNPQKREVVVSKVVVLDRVLYFEGVCKTVNEKRVFKFTRIKDRMVLDKATGENVLFKTLFNLKQNY